MAHSGNPDCGGGSFYVCGVKCTAPGRPGPKAWVLRGGVPTCLDSASDAVDGEPVVVSDGPPPPASAFDPEAVLPAGAWAAPFDQQAALGGAGRRYVAAAVRDGDLSALRAVLGRPGGLGEVAETIARTPAEDLVALRNVEGLPGQVAALLGGAEPRTLSSADFDIGVWVLVPDMDWDGSGDAMPMMPVRVDASEMSTLAPDRTVVVSATTPKVSDFARGSSPSRGCTRLTVGPAGDPLEPWRAEAAGLLVRDTPEAADYLFKLSQQHCAPGGVGPTSGSRFLRHRFIDDVVAAAAASRGNLDGDDRELLLAAGTDPSALVEGARYLAFRSVGDIGVVPTEALPADAQLRLVQSKPGVPWSVELTGRRVDGSVLRVDRPVTTDAVLIVGREDGRVWTAFPGPLLAPKSEDSFAASGFEIGETFSVGDIQRGLLDGRFQAAGVEPPRLGFVKLGSPDLPGEQATDSGSSGRSRRRDGGSSASEGGRRSRSVPPAPQVPEELLARARDLDDHLGGRSCSRHVGRTDLSREQIEADLARVERVSELYDRFVVEWGDASRASYGSATSRFTVEYGYLLDERSRAVLDAMHSGTWPDGKPFSPLRNAEAVERAVHRAASLWAKLARDEAAAGSVSGKKVKGARPPLAPPPSGLRGQRPSAKGGKSPGGRNAGGRHGKGSGGRAGQNRGR